MYVAYDIRQTICDSVDLAEDVAQDGVAAFAVEWMVAFTVEGVSVFALGKGCCICC